MPLASSLSAECEPLAAARTIPDEMKGSRRGMILVRSPIPCSEPDIEAEGTVLANKTMRLLLAAAVG